MATWRISIQGFPNFSYTQIPDTPHWKNVSSRTTQFWSLLKQRSSFVTPKVLLTKSRSTCWFVSMRSPSILIFLLCEAIPHISFPFGNHRLSAYVFAHGVDVVSDNCTYFVHQVLKPPVGADIRSLLAKQKIVKFIFKWIENFKHSFYNWLFEIEWTRNKLISQHHYG